MGMLDWFRSRRKQANASDDQTFDPERLPHWARVAMAARTARRVQFLARQNMSDVPARMMDSVENAILLAEQSARQGQAANNADETVKRLLSVPTESEIEAAVVQACAAAGQTVFGSTTDSKVWCHHAWEFAVEFCGLVGIPEYESHLWDDFKTLLEHCRRTNATDESLVDVSAVFGNRLT